MRCTKHPFDTGHDVCSHCGLVFCRACLVYPAGEGRSALCVACTVAMAVRSGARPVKAVKRRELKQRRRELAEYLETCPTTIEPFIYRSPIEDPPEEITLHSASASDHSW